MFTGQVSKALLKTKKKREAKRQAKSQQQQQLQTEEGNVKVSLDNGLANTSNGDVGSNLKPPKTKNTNVTGAGPATVSNQHDNVVFKIKKIKTVS